MSRLLAARSSGSVRGRIWTAARVQFRIWRRRIAYAASMVVAAGVMSTNGDMFQPAQVVTGAEAIAAVTRIATLASASAAAGGSGSSGVDER
jgi:hypothetical protein